MENQSAKLDKAVKISIIIAALIVALSVAYYLVIFLPHKETSIKKDAAPSKERIVTENIFDFQKMLELNLCQEAYDKYITSGSKERKGFDGFLPSCKYRGDDWKNLKIISTYLVNDYQVNVKYSVDIMMPDTDNLDYKRCLNNSFTRHSDVTWCDSVGQKVPKYNEWVETWFLEDGMWRYNY